MRRVKWGSRRMRRRRRRRRRRMRRRRRRRRRRGGGERGRGDGGEHYATPPGLPRGVLHELGHDAEVEVLGVGAAL